MRYSIALSVVCALLVSCGGGGGAHAPASPPTPGIQLLAGDVGAPGNVDGVGRLAHFHHVVAVASSPACGTFVAEELVIRRIDDGGVVTTWAGARDRASARDGAGTQARFGTIGDMAMAPDCTLYATDGTKVRRISPQGAVTTFASPTGLSYVHAIALAPDGTLFVTGGTPAGAALFRFDSAGNIVPVPARPAPGTDGLTGILDIAVDASHNIYLCDSQSHRIRKVSARGELTDFRGQPSSGGAGAEATWLSPQAVAFDAQGVLWVLDNGLMRRVTPEGVVSTPPQPGIATLYLRTLGARPDGQLVVAGSPTGYFLAGAGPEGVGRMDPATGTVAELAGALFASQAALADARRVAVDGMGNSFVLMGGSDRTVMVRKFGSDGTPLAWGPSGAAGITIPGDREGDRLQSMGVDAAGNVYVSDMSFSIGFPSINYVPSGGTIFRISAAGEVTTLASWPKGSAGARAPGAIAVMPDGSLFFNDLITGALWRRSPDGALQAVTGPNAQTQGNGRLALDRLGGLYFSTDLGGAILKLQGGAWVKVVSGLLRAGPLVFDAQDRALVWDVDVIRRYASDGSHSIVVGQRGHWGTSLGPLPGSLYVEGELAIAPDGSLRVLSGAALLRIDLP